MFFPRPLVALSWIVWLCDVTKAQVLRDSLSARNVSFFPSDPSLTRVPNFVAPASDLCSATFPCRNNATCHPVAGKSDTAFVCSCQPGWTGRVCEVDIDECAAKPCQNGAMCRNMEGSFQCYCVPGYLGELCEMEANECLANPCRNGAVCQDKLNGYECTCPAGFMGKQCERDIDECASSPCLNGAVCNNLRANFSCTCAAGFTGSRCEINIDECAHNRCLNGGRCIDGVNSFMCNCINTGHVGRLCEQEIDDCANSPCLYNGTCKDIGLDYSCTCYDGFMGRNCEVDIDECNNPKNPCQNEGTCFQRSNASLYFDHNLLGLPRAFSYTNSVGYVCLCKPGFSGKDCQISSSAISECPTRGKAVVATMVNIDDCEPKPCQNGATCIDLVDGYNCSCPSGWEGEKCDRDIDECQEEGVCSVHGKCQNSHGSWQCICEPGFGGKRCGVELLGCDHTECANGLKCPTYPKCAEGSTCVPSLQTEFPLPVHDFSCLCPPGRAGRLCQHSSIASFSTDGFISLLNQSFSTIAFDFRTTLNDSVLFVALDPTLMLTVQIDKGRLEVTAAKPSDSRSVEFDEVVTDGKWWNISVAVEGELFVVGLGNGHGNLEGKGPSTVKRMISLVPSGMVFGEMYFGGLEHRVRLLASTFRNNMNGCMRDIAISGQVLAPADLNTPTRRRQPSVRTSCERKEQCQANTCNKRGRCSDLWNRYECACTRPFYGLSCEKEIVAGTFNRESQKSLVSLILPQSDRALMELRTQLSLRIRTLEPNTLIAYLGSSNGNNYLTLTLQNGTLFLTVKVNSAPETFKGPPVQLNDGSSHFITVQRDQTMLEMVVDEETPIWGETMSGSPLKADVFLLGARMKRSGDPEVRKGVTEMNNDVVTVSTGMSVQKTRRSVEPELWKRSLRESPQGGPVFIQDNVGRLLKKRQTEVTVNNVEKGLFKGIIQDVRLNGKMVPLFEVSDSGQLEGLPSFYRNVVVESVDEGVKSDDTCKGNPCQNGGSCEVIWNDYRCSCPVAYRGKTCTLPNFCLSNECPSSFARCARLDDDYECLTNISLLDPTSSISYTPTKNFSSSLSSRKVSFRFRTRSSEASNILSLTSIHHELKVFIKQARIQLEYRLASAPSSITIDRSINDSMWHSFTAEFLERSMRIAIDGQTFQQPTPGSHVALGSVLSEENARVTVGGSFIGCLDDLRLGRFLLPVFPETFTKASQTLRRPLKLSQLVSIQYGCRGQDACTIDPCPTGRCVDTWNARKCVCDHGQEGCEETRGKSGQDEPRERLPCDGLTCRNGGVLICDELDEVKSGNWSQTPACNCTGDYIGRECEIHQATAAPTDNNLAIILGVTLSVAGLVIIGALTAFCLYARTRRAERGTYSPSRQEIFGSRVEMGYVLKPPPEERLI